MSAITPKKPSGETNVNVSRISVPPSDSANSCVWCSRANAPDTISSTKQCGGSKSVIREVRHCRTPKCVASKVTVSPLFILGYGIAVIVDIVVT